jgi:hypothetical protein
LILCEEEGGVNDADDVKGKSGNSKLNRLKTAGALFIQKPQIKTVL